jgi:hypothetical protein
VRDGNTVRSTQIPKRPGMLRDVCSRHADIGK